MALLPPEPQTLSHAPSPPLQQTAASSQGGWSRPDDRYLPLQTDDLTAILIESASELRCSPGAIEEFAAVLKEVIQQETSAFAELLAGEYAKFNPDRETKLVGEAIATGDDSHTALHTQLAYLLDKANYDRLDEVQIEQAVLQAKSRNLKVRVHPDRVDFLEVWVRGRGETTKLERSFWRPWQMLAQSVPVFKRMVVVARLKNNPQVVIKLFKDIPESDVEALLPHAEVTMSLLDRVKILGSTAGTLGLTISKVLKLMAALAALWYLTWIVVLGAATLGIRAVLGYRNARINRDWQRTQHLYFQNLANNSSALQLLIETVKQEEYKEVLLGYLFSHAAGIKASASDSSLLDVGQLRSDIEAFIKQRFNVRVDFDMPDAEAKLDRLGLCYSDSAAEVIPVVEAISRLRQLTRRDGVAGRILEWT